MHEKKILDGQVLLTFVEQEMLSINAIKEQLEQILSSHYFQTCQQLSNFLQFVVEETLAGREKQINQYLIAVKALNRSNDFNPQADPIVRIEARRLRRVLSQYYQELGQQDPIRIEIPKGGYVPTFKYNHVSISAIA